MGKINLGINLGGGSVGSGSTSGAPGYIPNGVVTSIATDVVAASVDQTVAEMYGESVAQLGLELSEIDDKYADKIIDVSEAANTHADMVSGKKSVSIIKGHTWPTRIAMSKNLLTIKPRIINGDGSMTFVIDSDGCVVTTGRSGDLRVTDETIGNEYWSQFAGKKVKFCSIGVDGASQCLMYHGGGSKNIGFNGNNSYQEGEEFVMPDDVRLVVVKPYIYGTGTRKMWFGLFVVEDGMPTVCDETVTTESNNIDTCYYKSIVTTKANTKEYIDRHSQSDDVKALYVMPEQFGAVGDGVTDDSEAINAAVQYAASKKLPVKMFQNYLVSKSVSIVANNIKIEANNIECTATDQPAVLIAGRHNTFSANEIKAKYIGIELTSTDVFCVYNDVKVNSIKAKYGIVLNPASDKFAAQNTFHFNLINGTGPDEGSIGITSKLYDTSGYVSENNFFGGQITNVEYAWKGNGSNNKFYSIHVEGNVNTGFWFVGNSYAQVYGDRHGEMTHQLTPYIKISWQEEIYNSMSADGEGLKFVSTAGIPINRIDVSGNFTKYIGKESEGVKYISDSGIGTIDCAINCGWVAEANGAYTTLAKRAYIWGKKVICEPLYSLRKTVTDALFDLRTNGNKPNVLPTTFNIGVEDCIIHLHDSYIHFGINKFRIIQTNAYKAKVYNSDGMLVWNGWTKPAGDYDFEISCSDDDGYKVGYEGARYDGEGICWYVNGEKQTLVEDEGEDLSYIETLSKTAYINTGITPSADYTYKAKIDISEIRLGSVFGSRISGNSQFLKVGFSNTTSVYLCNSATGADTSAALDFSKKKDTIATMILSKTGFMLKGESGEIYANKQINNGGVTNNNPVFLYQINNGGAVDGAPNYFARIQEFVIEDADGNELIHLHAALKDGVPCFYDSVSDSYKMFSGSGQVSYNKGDGSDAVVATI